MKVPPTHSAASASPNRPGTSMGSNTPAAMISWAAAHACLRGQRASTVTASVDSAAARIAGLKSAASVRAHALPEHLAHSRTHLLWHEGQESPALRSLRDLLAAHQAGS